MLFSAISRMLAERIDEGEADDQREAQKYHQYWDG